MALSKCHIAAKGSHAESHRAVSALSHPVFQKMRGSAQPKTCLPARLAATLTGSHDCPAALTINANAQTLILHSQCLKIARGLAAVRGQMPRSRLDLGDDSSAQTLTQPIMPGEL